MGCNLSLKDFGYTLVFSTIDIIISLIVYHFFHNFFILLVFIPIIISILCRIYFKNYARLIILCTLESLITVILLCCVGFFLGPMNEIAVIVIISYHLIVNTIPFVVSIAFLLLIKCRTGDGPMSCSKDTRSNK